MTKKWLTTIGLLAALTASSVSCGSVIRDGKSPVYLVIEELLGSRGAPSPGAASGNLVSDVITNVTSPPPCSPDTPCPTIFNDFGQVSLRLSPKNINPGGALTPPTLNNEVTITHYRVAYRRSDGRNTPGVDVPHGFGGGVTGTVPASGTLELGFDLVRHIAKMESPLIELQVNQRIIQATAEVTFFGRDQVGNELSVTGYILVSFGNFGDES
jgi:hypothetical protein